MATSAIKPPAGFILDQPTPPQGFVLDSAPSAESAPEPSDSWPYILGGGEFKKTLPVHAQPAYQEFRNRIENPNEFEQEMGMALFLGSVLQIPPENAIDLRDPLSKELFQQDITPSQVLSHALKQDEAMDNWLWQWNRIQRAMREPEMQSYRQDVFVNQLAKGMANVASGLAGQMEQLQQKPMPGSWMPMMPDEARKNLIAKHKANADLYWEITKNPDLVMQRDDAMSTIFGMAAETVPYITATTAASILAGPVGGFLVGHAVEGNDAYRTALEKGVPEEQARRIGAAVGLAAAAIEASGGLGTDMLFAKVSEKLLNKGLQAGAKMGFGSVSEAIEEASQELVKAGAETTYREVPWDEIVRRTLASAAGGAALGGGFHLGRTAMRLMMTGKNEQNWRLAEQYEAAKAKAINEMSKNPQTLETDAKVLEQTANEMEKIIQAAAQPGETSKALTQRTGEVKVQPQPETMATVSERATKGLPIAEEASTPMQSPEEWEQNTYGHFLEAPPKHVWDMTEEEYNAWTREQQDKLRKTGEEKLTMTPTYRTMQKQIAERRQAQAGQTPAEAPVGPEATEETVTVYTGSDEPFTQFDITRIGTRTDEGFAGRGAYTTTNRDVAGRWGTNVMATTIQGGKWIEINKQSELQQYGLKTVENVHQKSQEQVRRERAQLVNEFSDKAVAEGYDGVKWTMSNGDVQYVLFKPEQYKFTDVTSGEAPVVPETPAPVGAQQAPPPATVQPETTEVSEPPTEKGRRVSRAAQRIDEEAIARDLTESLGDLPTYERMSMKEQARMAAAEIEKDYENAKQMAYGKVPPPKGLRPASIYRAVAVKAREEGDVETLRNLAVVHPQISEELTAMGQQIKAADVGVDGDPIKAMRSVAKERERIVKKRQKIRDVPARKRAIAQNMKKEIHKATTRRQTWSEFVESIRC